MLIYNAASSERETVQKSMVDVARTLSTAVDSEIGRTMLGLRILAMSPALDGGNIDAFRQEAEAARALHGRWSNVGHDSLRYGARIEVALRKFVVDGGFGAFTTRV